MYLADMANRPIFQGDIFDGVPFVKAKAAGSVENDPNLVVERRRVCIIGYPCDIYDAHGRLAKVQTVALVRDGSSDGVPENWNGSFSVCPFPELDSDEKLWVADFRTVTNVDRDYLPLERRLVSLSEVGWAIFRQRLALAYTRALMNVEKLHEIGRQAWQETQLWQLWNSHRDMPEFQEWFTKPREELSGFTPKQAALERGDYNSVRVLIEEISKG
jgi:hypothetical protein